MALEAIAVQLQQKMGQSEVQAGNWLDREQRRMINKVHESEHASSPQSRADADVEPLNCIRNRFITKRSKVACGVG